MQETHDKESALLKDQVQQEWVSYPEAEHYSGLSHTTLWRCVRSGQLKAARVGRSVRIHFPSLRGFMERAAEKAVDE
jgi:excisionase family DNA binding protein